MLPWWLGIFLAVVSYFVLHFYATRPVTFIPSNPPRVTDVFAPSILSALCLVFQFLIPPGFVIGAVISCWKSVKPKTLLATAKKMPKVNRLRSFTWREFESLVGQTFRERGYTVVERGGDGSDGGVDLELRMGNDKYLVQCKHWKTQSVGVAKVRELFGVMSAEGAVGGFMVASGSFTAEAAKFAEGRSIELLQASALVHGIGQQFAAQIRQHQDRSK